MKIKRERQADGSYLIVAKNGHSEVLNSKWAKPTKLRVGYNKFAWEYGQGPTVEGVAFSLREVEQRVLQDALQSIAATAH